MKSDDDKVAILNEPLEVMFTPNLEEWRALLVNGNRGAIVGKIP